MDRESLKPLKVLYLEDEVLIALHGQDLLRELGFGDVTLAVSLAEAQKQIAAKSFDFALLDINLGGGKTSLVVAEELQARGTCVLFASGYESSQGLSEKLRAPMLPKPFNEASLRDAVFDVLAKHADKMSSQSANAK